MRFVVLIIALLIVAPVPSHAQTSGGTSVQIVVSPDFPEPGEDGVASLTASGITLSQAKIAWSLDGVTIASGIGLTSIPVHMGTLGSSRTLAVAVQDGDGPVVGDTFDLTPSVVSLVWEANSYTPPWYKGRALPSPGVSVKIAAHSWFVDKKGTRVPDSEILYTWKKNNIPLSAQSGLGRSSVLIPGPQMYGDDTVSVSLDAKDGSFHSEASVRIPSTLPHVTLYTMNGAGGVSYNNAITDATEVHDTETTLVAEPYFMSVSSRSDANLQYDWHVDSESATPDKRDASQLVLILGRSNGAAVTVQLAVTHLQSLLQTAQKSWQIMLTPGRSIETGPNPFTGE